jgi:SAM-dependent methyltransferase
MTGATFTSPADTWNKRFESEDYIFGREPNDYLRSHAAQLAPGGRVLSVADGEGRNSVWLALQGMHVDAFDIAEVGVAKARKLAAEAHVTVTFTVADCDSFAWPIDTYDTVAAIFVQFADPPMRDRLFAHMVSSLKRGGLILVQGYTPKQLEYKTGGPPLLSHLYTAEMLRSAFATLEILELREYEAEMAEGSRHHGRSALIGLLARKP